MEQYPNTTSSKYSIRNKISNVTSSEYSIQNKISNVTSSEYLIQSRITKTYNSQYNIGGQILNTTSSEYSIRSKISNVTSSSYNIIRLPKRTRLLLHNNTTNEVLAYTIQNRNSYISDSNYNFTYPVSAAGIATEEKSIWSILAFRSTAQKYNRNGILEQTINLSVINRPEQGVAWHNDRLYVVSTGSFTRRVYVYDTTDNSLDSNWTTVFATGNPRSIVIYNEKVYIATLTPGALYAYSLTGDRMEDDDIILPSDIDPIRSTAITDDILTLVTVASGVSTLHMVDLRNNVSGQENTVVTTIEISGASIQGATSQIFYPIQKINSEYSIQNIISNTISSSYAIDGLIIDTKISSSYSIRNKISNVTSSKYSVQNIISKTIPSEYSIQNIITNVTSSEYLIQNIITNAISSEYSIQNITSNITSSKYSIQNIISNAISIRIFYSK